MDTKQHLAPRPHDSRAAALGGPVFFTEQNVERIAGRPDEAYRQRALKM